MRILAAWSLWLLFSVAACADSGLECWPSTPSTCREAGWRWYNDYATSYCPGSSCGPPTEYPFCAHPCADDADCTDAIAPHCGRVGYWGGSDGKGCSPFKACIPLEFSGGSCYSPGFADLCPR